MAEKIYGTLEYIEAQKNNTDYEFDRTYNQGHWKISGPQPAMMAQRVIPDSYSRKAATIEIPDNMCNVEHIEWLMMRYPLEIKTLDRWTARTEQLSDIRLRRINLKTIVQAIVDARFNGTLMDFQKEGLDFLLKTSGIALVADEMGLGKTIETLAYLVTEKDAFPCLVVAPLVTLINWQREIAKFIHRESGKPFIVKTIRTGKSGDIIPQVKLAESEKGQPQIILINYDLVSKRRDDIAKIPFRTIVADECQNLRNPESLKSRALRELANLQTVKHRIGLSGTPCYNHGTEIWSICDFIYPGLLGTYVEFGKEFVNFWDPKKAVYAEKRGALFEILSQNIMIRRRKLDVLTNLPDKVRFRQTIQINEEYYQSEMEKHLEELNTKLAVAKSKTKFQAISELEAYNSFANNERITAGVAKVPYVIQFIEEILETGEPVVVYCHHDAVYERLNSRLWKYNPVTVRGGQSDNQRQEAIDNFQNGETKLLIAGLRAGNVGINLTAAAYVIFAELDWSPAIHRQAEDRLHRIGQKKTVFAYYLEGIKTLDEKVAEVLTSKKLELDEVLGDVNRSDQYAETEKLSDQTKLLVQRLQERFKKIGATVPDLPMEDLQNKDIEEPKETEVEDEVTEPSNPQRTLFQFGVMA